jgi:hypothetical protein
MLQVAWKVVWKVAIYSGLNLGSGKGLHERWPSLAGKRMLKYWTETVYYVGLANPWMGVSSTSRCVHVHCKGFRRVGEWLDRVRTVSALEILNVGFREGVVYLRCVHYKGFSRDGALRGWQIIIRGQARLLWEFDRVGLPQARARAVQGKCRRGGGGGCDAMRRDPRPHGGARS